jgi:hypothetical protein
MTHSQRPASPLFTSAPFDDTGVALLTAAAVTITQTQESTGEQFTATEEVSPSLAAESYDASSAGVVNRGVTLLTTRHGRLAKVKLVKLSASAVLTFL